MREKDIKVLLDARYKLAMRLGYSWVAMVDCSLGLCIHYNCVEMALRRRLDLVAAKA